MHYALDEVAEGILQEVCEEAAREALSSLSSLSSLPGGLSGRGGGVQACVDGGGDDDDGVYGWGAPPAASNTPNTPNTPGARAGQPGTNDAPGAHVASGADARQHRGSGSLCGAAAPAQLPQTERAASREREGASGAVGQRQIGQPAQGVERICGAALQADGACDWPAVVAHQRGAEERSQHLGERARTRQQVIAKVIAKGEGRCEQTA